MDESGFVYSFFDWSGSNVEYGKSRLLRNLARTLCQLRELRKDELLGKIEFRLFSVDSNIKPIELDNLGDVPVFKFSGRMSVKMIADFLVSECSLKKEVRAILFSDGNFDEDDIGYFCNVTNKMKNLVFIGVATGIDSDKSKMQKLCKYVFDADNILLAAECTASIDFNEVCVPNCIDDFLG